jgi:hypothetical protein
MMKLVLAILMMIAFVGCTKKSETNHSIPLAVSTEAPAMQDLPDPNAPVAKEKSQDTGIKIDAKDLACKKDSDCTIVRTQCSCHCGEAVNTAQAAKYTALAETACKDYAGPMCKKLCRGEAKCVDKVCSYVP